MLLVLINWFVAGYVCLMHGFALRNIFAVEPYRSTVAICIIWGLAEIGLLGTIWLFFLPINLLFLVLLMMGAIAIHFFQYDHLSSSLRQFARDHFTPKRRWASFLLVFVLAFSSAGLSKIPDDSLYYTPTVLWFVGEGFVRGISNLNLPVGLGSSWHVVQAVFSFSFLEGLVMNDLNGFLIFIFFIFSLEQLPFFMHNGYEKLLFVFLVSVSIVISMLFVTACSPDLPVLLLTIVSFVLLLQVGRQHWHDIMVIGAFGFSIKLSAIILTLLALITALRSFHRAIRKKFLLYILVVLIVVLAVCKNVYQTGYPFFPFDFFGFPNLPWATPEQILAYYYKGLKLWGLEDIGDFHQLNHFENPGVWRTLVKILQRDDYKGTLNVIIVSAALLSTVVLLARWLKSKTQLSKTLLFALGLELINLILWLVYSPQYRFILPAFIFFFSVISAGLFAMVGNYHWLTTIITRVLAALCVLFICFYPPTFGHGAVVSWGHFQGTSFILPDQRQYPVISYEWNNQQYFYAGYPWHCAASPLPCLPPAFKDFLQTQGYQLINDNSGSKSYFYLRKE